VCLSFTDARLHDWKLRSRIQRARRQWDRVILRFAERYRVWEP
jgi:hypothetical protein